MIDRLFAAVLTFSILIGATLAFGVELFGTQAQVVASHAAPAAVREVRLERVVVTGKRIPVDATHVAAAGTGLAINQ